MKITSFNKNTKPKKSLIWEKGFKMIERKRDGLGIT
jgi:hypothetical protein